MNISFNQREDASGGKSYFAPDFMPGPAQEAGLSLPTWFQFPDPILALPESPSVGAFANLLNNKTPNGASCLTLRNNSASWGIGINVARRAAYELTFSSWKWLTVLALCLGDTRILRVWENAIWNGLLLSASFAATRVRKAAADHDRTTGHIVGILNHHIESRAGDPQLHSHAIFFNVTWDPVEACFKALQFDPILKQKALICHWVAAQLLEGLWCLGYDIEPAVNGFRIAGFSDEAVLILSKRARSLEENVKAATQRKSKISWKDKKNLVVFNRPAKKAEDLATMYARWRGEIFVHLKSLENLVAAARSKKRIPIPRINRMTAARRVLDITLDALLEKRAYVTTELLLASALAKADGGWSGGDAKAIINLQIEDGHYLRRFDHSLTTPGRQRRLLASFLHAHGVLGPMRPIHVRIPNPDLNHALHLTLSHAKIIVAATITSVSCKAAVQAFHAGLKYLGVSPHYAVPAGVAESGPAMPLSLALAGGGKTVVIGQSEALSHSELDAILEFAALPGSQVILFASQKALKDHRSPSLVSALARHRWVPFTDITLSETRSYRVSQAFLVPHSLISIEGQNHRALLKVAENAARCLANHEIVQVVVDDSALEKSLVEEIEKQLESIAPGAATHILTCSPRPSKAPEPGDTGVCETATRHFAQGEHVSVIQASRTAITVKKSDGTIKSITPKVWAKLTHVTLTKMQIQSGTVLTLSAGVPGKKHRLGVGTTVQVKSVGSEGAICLTNGDELPASFRFFRNGAVASATSLKKKAIDKVFALLRKSPGRLMRALLRELFQKGKLLGIVVRKRAHLKGRRSLVVQHAMAKAHLKSQSPLVQSDSPRLNPPKSEPFLIPELRSTSKAVGKAFVAPLSPLTETPPTKKRKQHEPTSPDNPNHT